MNDRQVFAGDFNPGSDGSVGERRRLLCILKMPKGFVPEIVEPIDEGTHSRVSRVSST
jgi:hypothetical protein